MERQNSGAFGVDNDARTDTTVLCCRMTSRKIDGLISSIIR